jgi:hypothetical protein
VKLKLTRRKAKLLSSAIHEWLTAEILSPEEGQKLLGSFVVAKFDWKRLAKYSFWISLVCLMIAVGSILADRALMALLARIFRAPDIIKCLSFAFVAMLFYHWGIKRKKKASERIFSNEAIFFLGVVATGASIAFWGKIIDSGKGHFSILLLISSITYAILGLWVPSKLVWIFALLSLGSWFGAETGYMSAWGAYYLGMNYPLRFVFFGIGLTAGSVLFRFTLRRQEFLKSTRVMGLLYLFIAVWILSIFGNYGDFQSWDKAKQIELFHWSLLFGLLAAVAILHGIRFDDPMTRGFGLAFLFINLYTRYFEYFWDTIHKAIFFGFLAISFWLVGSRAEKIWNMTLFRQPGKIEPQGERAGDRE